MAYKIKHFEHALSSVDFSEVNHYPVQTENDIV